MQDFGMVWCTTCCDISITKRRELLKFYINASIYGQYLSTLWLQMICYPLPLDHHRVQNTENKFTIWVRSWRCRCFVTWFCYHLIAKPGNKTTTLSWPNPCVHEHILSIISWKLFLVPWLISLGTMFFTSYIKICFYFSQTTNQISRSRHFLRNIDATHDLMVHKELKHQIVNILIQPIHMPCKAFAKRIQGIY